MTEEEAGVGLAAAGTAEAAIAVAEALPAVAGTIKNKAAPKTLMERVPLAGIHPTLLTAFCTLVLLHIPQVMSYGPETAQLWQRLCAKRHLLQALWLSISGIRSGVMYCIPWQKAGCARLLCSADGRGGGREGPDGYLPPPPRGRGGANRGRGDMHSDGGRSFSDRGRGVARGGGEFARGGGRDRGRGSSRGRWN